ncbi:MAG: hypothetical protein H0W83_14745 [Planctomycetes bacterium]|nr:hypothetical protein [Planctomycetota bacterium]
MLAHPAFEASWSRLTVSSRAAIAEAVVGMWMTTTCRFTRAQYLAGGHLTDSETPFADPDGRWGDRIWYTIPQLRRIGVSEPVLSGLIAWARMMWPGGDVQALMSTGSDGASTGAGRDDRSASPHRADGCGIGSLGALLLLGLVPLIRLRRR